MRKIGLVAACSALVLAGWGASVRATPVNYLVTVDTSSIAGQNGFLDLEFNGTGFPSTQSATAVVSNFTTDGALGSESEAGHITGSLASTPFALTFDNQNVNSDYTAAFTFAKTMSFDVAFSGPAFSNPDGTGSGVFQIDFLNSDQTANVLTNDPDGTTQFPGDYRDFNTAVFQVNGDGTATPTTFANLGGGPSAATITEVPEPASAALLFAAAVPSLLIRRSMRRSR